MKLFLIKLIRFYQEFVSPLLPRACRFYPSCSEYAIQCLQTHNLLTAVYLSSKRILKCNPLFEGGFDPIPKKSKESQTTEGHNGRKKL